MILIQKLIMSDILMVFGLWTLAILFGFAIICACIYYKDNM